MGWEKAEEGRQMEERERRESEESFRVLPYLSPGSLKKIFRYTEVTQLWSLWILCGTLFMTEFYVYSYF
jgi:hypothetical protein